MSTARKRLEPADAREALLRRLLAREGLPQGDVPIARRPDRDEPAQLSFAQQRLWFLDQLNPANPFYNIHHALRLDFPLDVGIVRRALDEIVRRHEALRTTFHAVEGRPVQVVAPEVRLEVPVIELADLGPEAAEARALELATAEARRPFDLSRGPLLRASILHLGPARWVLALTIHHIVADGWSLRVLFDELATLYEAFAAGRPSPLAPLAVQYPDFAVWQREYLAGERLEAQLSYWRRRLEGLPTLELPTDRPRPPAVSFAGATVPFRLEPSLATRLRSFAAAAGATPFMALLTGFAALLGRYSGQDDLPIGSYIAGRTRAELEPLIGFFVNTLVLRVELGGEPSLREALGRVRETALGAYAHQDVPFEKLVEVLAPARDPSRNPLCQVAFQLFSAPAGRAAGRPSAGAGVEALPVERGTAVFDLVVTTVDEPDGAIGGRIEYSTELFEAATIERLAGHYARLLAGALDAPDRPLAEIELVGDDERKQLARWNATEAPYPAAGLAELFAAQAARTPDAPAVLAEGEPPLSYRELDARANRLAHHLAGLGVGPEVLVGLCAERSIQLIVGFLATLKAGGAYLPLDPAYPPERLTHMLADAHPAVVLRQDHLASALPASDAIAVSLDRLDALTAGLPETLPALEPDPERLAYVIYTSGSTGMPKGALVPCRGLGNLVAEQIRLFGVGPGDRVLQFSSLSFDAATFEIAMALCTGATLCVGPRDALMPGRPLATFLQRHRVTVVTLPPSALAALDPEHAPSLRVVNVAGETCPASLVARWAPGRRFFNLYGPSEATIWSTVQECVESSRRPPIGRPIANVRCHVVERSGALAPIGVPGELWLGGIGIGRGYVDRPELTAERFVIDPFGEGRAANHADAHTGAPTSDSGQRLYRTGDLVRRRSDGSLDFLGRTDWQVKIRGVRIELGELESHLEEHAGVRGAVVVARDDARSGRSLVAYVVPEPGWGAERSEVQVDMWRRLYEETYAQAPAPEDGRFHLVGWQSSYTGQPIPPAEMREWVDATVERIRRLRPRRVLEIGCGTGLLLFRLAPSCERYVGTDFAREALDHIRAELARLDPPLAQVSLVEGAAADIGELDELRGERFDTIILNSVVQYFPDVEHVVRVVEAANGFLEPGGRIFVGDVRSLSLLEAFATSIELARAPATLAAGALRERVRRRVESEQELALDPAVFAALAERLPGLAGVRVEPKGGRYDNELSRFRCDVTLFRESATGSPRPELVACESLANVRALLEEAASRAPGGAPSGADSATPDVVAVVGLANRRVVPALDQVTRLAEADPETSIGDLLAQFGTSSDGVEPEDVHALAESLGWRVDVELEATPDRFDAVFRRDGAHVKDDSEAEADEPIDCWPLSGPVDIGRPWLEYGNAPARGMARRQLVPELRELLERRLPEAMLPSWYVVVDALPVSPNGKVDRSALPAPDTARPELAQGYVAPRTALEATIGSIWSGVIGIDEVGADDDFFALGGHSLLATQVVARVRDAFDLELPLRALFEHRTLAGFAVAVEETMTRDITTLSEEEAERLVRGGAA